jgi:hypothetical protein
MVQSKPWPPAPRSASNPPPSNGTPGARPCVASTHSVAKKVCRVNPKVPRTRVTPPARQRRGLAQLGRRAPRQLHVRQGQLTRPTNNGQRVRHHLRVRKGRPSSPKNSAHHAPGRQRVGRRNALTGLNVVNAQPRAAMPIGRRAPGPCPAQHPWSGPSPQHPANAPHPLRPTPKAHAWPS